jgi:hypothetical protein
MMMEDIGSQVGEILNEFQKKKTSFQDALSSLQDIRWREKRKKQKEKSFFFFFFFLFVVFLFSGSFTLAFRRGDDGGKKWFDEFFENEVIPRLLVAQTVLFPFFSESAVFSLFLAAMRCRAIGQARARDAIFRNVEKFENRKKKKKKKKWKKLTCFEKRISIRSVFRIW